MTALPKDWIMKDKSLFIKNNNILILSDIHLGRFDNTTQLLERIHNLINHFNPDILVLNGDTWNQDSFNNENITLISELKTNVNELIIIKGNHEEKFDEFTKKFDERFKIKKEYKIDNILIHHGHHTPTQKAKHHIIGHIHPAVDGKPVYLHCDDSYYGSSVTILPMFNNVANSLNIDYSYNYASHCPIINDGKNLKEYNILHT